LQLELKYSQFHLEHLPLSKSIMQMMTPWLENHQEKYSEKRKIQFLGGRYCALIALEKINYHLTALPILESRAPAWPQGICGSISHNNEFAIALVSDQCRSVGVDVENLMSNERFENIKKIIATENEIKVIEKNICVGQTLIFSAKEALYKMIYPLALKYFGFLDATLLSFDDENFQIELHADAGELQAYNGIYIGRYLIQDKTLISYIEC